MKKFLSIFIALAMVFSLFAGVGARSAKAVGLAITPATLPDGTAGAAYTQTLVVTSGTAPYTWALVSSLLPAGLTLGSTTGVISGTPTAAGTYSFTVQATDSSSPAVTGTITYTLGIVSATALAVSTASLPGGAIGIAYTTTLAATGGLPPYSWTSTALPAGLTLSSSGVLSGTPTAIGTTSITFAVTDSQTTPATASSGALSLVIGAAPALAVTTASLPAATVMTAYTTTLAATGGVGPYTWTSTALPAGLTLSSSGVLSGTPTAIGTTSITFTVTDSQTIPETASSGALSLVVSSAAAGTISGLHSVSTETLFPTYTFLDDAVVQGYYYSPNATSHTVTVAVTDGPVVNVFQVGLNQYMFSFALKTPITAEGIKTITVTDPGYPTVTQSIYVAYKVTVNANPAPAYNTASFLYGTVSNGDGLIGTTTIALINGVAGSATSPLSVAVTAGTFNFSYNFPTRGDYRLVLSNTANVPTYQKWALGGSITATTVLDPNPIYASGAAQESYLYLSYEDGSAVTDASVALTSGVNTSFLATEIGNGFYLLSGSTTTTVGNNYYTITKGGLTLGYTLYFKAMDSVWNPSVKIATADLLTYGPGGTLHFTVSYGVNGANYWQNDWYTTITGPGKQNSSTFYVEYGGQVKLTLDANLWYNASADAQTAKPVDVEQVFTVNPTIMGDQVTISATKVNVGDTKDITVTVKKANGIERNNAKVELISTVSGMFTAPVGSAYTVSYDGKTATLDASGLINYNIVGGNYIFAGLTFNHKGYIEVKVTGTDNTVTWVTADFIATNSYNYGIRVYPLYVTLTADVAKFTAGVAYPVVNISGAVAGLTGWAVSDLYGAGDNPVFSYVDKGSGSYTFNFSTMHYAFGSLTLYSYDSTGDTQYKIVFPVSMPTLMFTSVHSDGKLTDSFAETVKLQVTDPLTGAAIAPSAAEFIDQKLMSSSALGSDDPYLDNLWDPGISTAKILQAGTYSYDVTTNTVTVAGLQATKGNQYVDYTVNAPTLYLSYTVNGVDLWFMNALVVTAPSITINKPAATLTVGVKNTINVTALDAHGAPMVKAAVALAGSSDADFAGSQINTGYGYGGITNDQGVVEFYATPAYMGTYRLVLGAPIYAADLVTITGYSIVYRKDILSVPGAANTAPVITVASGIDGSTVSAATLTLTGTVTDDYDTISYVYINGAQVNVVGGAFTYAVKLVAGANTITLQAADSANALTTETITVTYAAAATKTVIMLTIGTNIVTVNGKATSIDAAPEIINGRTFVPIRFISETFGATVDWLAETQGITVTLGDSTIGLQIGNATAVIDGSIVSLEAAPYIKNGRTMVPLRVISEAFGGDVAWDPALRTITISY